jgi:predicted nicotinamide N-methyase
MPHRAPAPPPGYQTKTETIRTLGADLQLRSLLNRQQFHDPHGEAERAGIFEAQWPLFGLLWPSGLVLADSMLTHDLAGKRVLELGCGLALASLVVHRRGGDITASDRHPLTEAFLLENLKLNQLGAMKYTTGDWAGSSNALGKFDLIIGSDVLYDRDMPRLLSGFINRHSSDVVEVLIVDPNRGNRASFNRKMDRLGYAHTHVSLSALPSEGGPYKGRLLSYRRDITPR